MRFAPKRPNFAGGGSVSKGSHWVLRELGWVFAGGGWREGKADEREKWMRRKKSGAREGEEKECEGK